MKRYKRKRRSSKAIAGTAVVLLALWAFNSVHKSYRVEKSGTLPAALAPKPAAPVEESSHPARVIAVLDPVTIQCEIVGDVAKPVKLTGLAEPKNFYGSMTTESYRAAATDFLKKTIDGGLVRIQRYGDETYLYTEDGSKTFLNLELALQGWAIASFNAPPRHSVELLEATQDAESHRRGIWKDRPADTVYDSPASRSQPPKSAGSSGGGDDGYSSICGAPTKNGGTCQNRVKGGGRCHLHK